MEDTYDPAWVWTVAIMQPEKPTKWPLGLLHLWAARQDAELAWRWRMGD